MKGPSIRKGQAIVEAVLGILVFVTVLMFGIHFTEITFTQMKVTEAGQAAVWESTAGQMHIIPAVTGNFTDVNARVAFGASDAMARYADFDGAATGPGLPQQIFSTARAGSMQVRCNTGIGLNQTSGDFGGAGFILTPTQWIAYRDNGGMECTSQADIDTGGVSKIGTFLEGSNGFFNKRGDASHKQSVTATNGYHVCGLNKSGTVNGACRGSFSMLIDDWGLASGGSESGNCPILPYGIPCPGNINFWMAAKLAYDLNSNIFGTTTGDDHTLLRTIVAAPFWPGGRLGSLIPGNPTSFYMGVCGEDTAGGCLGMFTEFTPWHGDGSWWFWQTSPFLVWPTYALGYAGRSECYLGQDCTPTANSP